jgi:hypothetical protein
LEPISYPIIQDIREKIIEWRAGTVRNSSDGYIVKNNEVQGIVTQNGDTILANKMILLGILPRYF